MFIGRYRKTTSTTPPILNKEIKIEEFMPTKKEWYKTTKKLTKLKIGLKHKQKISNTSPKNPKNLEKNNAGAPIFLLIKLTKVASGISDIEKFSALLNPITKPKTSPNIIIAKKVI